MVRAAALTILVSATVPAVALSVQVQLIFSEAISASERSAEIDLLLLLDSEELHRLRAPLSATRPFDLLPGKRKGALRVTCEAEELICPVIEIRDPEAVLLPVYPTYSATARISGVVEGEAETLRAEAWLMGPTRERFHFTPAATVLQEGLVRFPLPMEKVDLRLSVEGLAPWYRWGLEPRQDQPPLDAQMVRGSSIAGFLRDGDSGGSLAGASLVAEPMAGPAVVSDEGREAIRRHETESKASGFFQIRGLPPGQFVLTVVAEGYAWKRIGPIPLEKASETVLGEVELRRLQEVQVEVKPPMGPGSTPWTVKVESAVGAHPKRQITLDELGMGILELVAPAEVDVTLGVADDILHAERVDLSVEPGIFLELTLVPVEGHLTLEGDPIPGRVFLSTGGRDRSETVADEEGRFHSWLREPPDGLVVDVRADSGAIQRTLVMPAPQLSPDGVLHLEVELTDRWIAGAVFHADGRPAVDAFVEIIHETDPLFAPVLLFTDDSGSFVTRGLPRGRFYIEATFEDREFASLEGVEATREPSGEAMEMKLSPGRPVDGFLTDAEGDRLSGAWIRSKSWGPQLFRSNGSSDSDGSFRVHVHPDASQVQLVVEAPQSGLWTTCVALPSESEGDLVVSMPAGPRGSLRVLGSTSDWNRKRPPAYRLQILSDLGGSFGYADLLRSVYSASVGGLPAALREDPPYLDVPGIVAGRYAVLDASAGPTAFTCSPTLPTNGGWSLLPPGGSAELRMDIPNVLETGGDREFPPLDP